MSSQPCPGTLGNLRSPVVGEAILPLRVDWWKNRFAVDFKSSPQGLPDLLCVCNDITKSPNAPVGSQSFPTFLEPSSAGYWGKATMPASPGIQTGQLSKCRYD